MKNSKILRLLQGLALVNLALLPSLTQATPYASGLTNDAGTIRFFLNEVADNVSVVRDNGAGGTDNLGALASGKHSFSLGTNTSYRIEVTKVSGAGYKVAAGTNATKLLISPTGTNNYFLNFEQPKDVSINKNPGSPFFGRIYVGNSRISPAANGRQMEVGLYMVNPDYTSAHPEGLEDFARRPDNWPLSPNTTSSTNFFPYNITIGPDDTLYVSDWSNPTGNLWVTDPSATFEGVAALKLLPFDGAVFPVGAGNTHGSISAAHVEGTSAGGNLKIWTIDEDIQTDPASTNRTELNSIWRYDVGSSNSFPYQNAGTKVWTPAGKEGHFATAQTTDFVRATNGNFYVTTLRAVIDVSGLAVVSPTGTPLWNSYQASTNLLNSATAADILANARRVAVSPDCKYVAVLRATGIAWLIPMVNGIPQLAQRLSLIPNTTGNTMDGVEFDAAGNLYVVSRSTEIVTIYSPGGSTKTVTSSDGTFQSLSILPEVTVAATTGTATEGGAAGQFTLTRTGPTNATLAVSFTLSGTAANGTDYVSISTNATFALNSSTVTVNVTPSPDVIPELTETVTLTLNVSETYAVASPSSATVNLLDNEPAEVSIAVLKPTLLESHAFSKATYELTRKGLISSALAVSVSYSGAVNGVDFNGPTSVNMGAGASTATFELTPVNNNSYSGDRSILASVTAGAGYAVGTPSSATVTLVDDEFPAGTPLFSDKFPSDTSVNWIVNRTATTANSGSDTVAEFGFDYNTFGIPVAPATTDATTKGLKLAVNVNSTFLLNAAINVSPVGFNFTGDYRMMFDMWLNYNGPMFTGGSGSTFGLVSGLGTTGNRTQIPKVANGSDGVLFKVSNDGAEGTLDGDYTVYTNAVQMPGSSGAYAAGTGTDAFTSSAAYYSIWGVHPAPAAQLALYPGQTGDTEVGCIGMSWHSVAITKLGDVVTWSIDGVKIASVTNSVNAPLTTTGNVFVGWYDPYSGTAPVTCFAVVDNFRVEGVSTAPPVLGIARSGNSVTLTWTGPATLQEASVLTGSPGDWSNIAGSSGVTIPASTGIKFYRLVQ